MKHAWIAGAAIALMSTAVASAQDVDLAALIECRADDVKAYNALAFALIGGERKETLQRLGRRAGQHQERGVQVARLLSPSTAVTRGGDGLSLRLQLDSPRPGGHT